MTIGKVRHLEIASQSRDIAHQNSRSHRLSSASTFHHAQSEGRDLLAFPSAAEEQRTRGGNKDGFFLLDCDFGALHSRRKDALYVGNTYIQY